MKKTMSISTSLFLGKIVLGILWICIAVTNCFDGLFASISSIVLLLAAIVILIILSKIKPANEDEMSDYNYKEARAIASEIMHIIYLILAIATPFVLTKFDISDWNWPIILGNIFYMLVGIQNILVGIYFRKLEAE